MNYNIKARTTEGEFVVFSLEDGVMCDKDKGEIRLFKRKGSLLLDSLQLGFALYDVCLKEVFLGDIVRDLSTDELYYLDYDESEGVVFIHMESKRKGNPTRFAFYAGTNTRISVNKDYRYPEYECEGLKFDITDITFDTTVVAKGQKLRLSRINQKISKNSYSGSYSLYMSRGKIRKYK